MIIPQQLLDEFGYTMTHTECLRGLCAPSANAEMVPLSYTMTDVWSAVM